MPRKKHEVQDTWEAVGKAYEAAQAMSCKPGPAFPKVRTGDVIDEEKSVRWNREEVERRKAAYQAEVARLNKEKNKAVSDAVDRAVALIADEARINLEKARYVWNFAYEKHHAYGEVFYFIDEYIEFAARMAGNSSQGPSR